MEKYFNTVSLLWRKLILFSLYGFVVTQDCLENDRLVYVDDMCLALQPLAPISNTLGSNVTSRCASRLQYQATAGFDFCPVELCTSAGWTDSYLSCAADECYDPGFSKDYMGKRTCTLSGTNCQSWSSQTPHPHTFASADFPDADLQQAGTYCRDPAGTKGTPWCYTTDPLVEWEYCEIPKCADLPLNNGDCADCGAPDMSIAVDHPCTDYIPPTPPTETITGNYVQYGCNTLLSKVASSVGFCPVERCNMDGLWTNGSRSCGDNECYEPGAANWYQGHQTCTETGEPCVRWDSMPSPYPDASFPEGSAALAGSYCRDPDNSGIPWCYVSTFDDWGNCGVASCTDIPIVPAVCDGLTTEPALESTTTQDMSCDSPPVITNAAMESEGNIIGDRSVYSCNQGFTSGSGNMALTCNQDLVWEGDPPACIAKAGGVNSFKQYLHVNVDVESYTLIISKSERSRLQCASQCTKDRLCKLYLYDSAIDKCDLYMFDTTGTLVSCSGMSKCYLRDYLV